MYTNGYFMLLFDLTLDSAASEGHTYNSDNVNIRVKLKFFKSLPDTITCFIYLEYDGSVFIDDKRTVNTDY